MGFRSEKEENFENIDTIYLSAINGPKPENSESYCIFIIHWKYAIILKIESFLQLNNERSLFTKDGKFHNFDVTDLYKFNSRNNEYRKV